MQTQRARWHVSRPVSIRRRCLPAGYSRTFGHSIVSRGDRSCGTAPGLYVLGDIAWLDLGAVRPPPEMTCGWHRLTECAVAGLFGRVWKQQSLAMMHPDRLLRIVKDPSAQGTYAAAWALDCVGRTPQVTVLGGGQGLPDRPLVENQLFLLFGAPGTGTWEEFLGYLPGSDQDQIARLRRPLDRWAVAAARATLRSLLAVPLGCLPEEVGLIRDIHGKPALDPARHGSRGRQIHFNISHTRGLVAVALAGSPIGVDVEFVSNMEDMLSVAKTAFPDESIAALLASPSDLERRSLFFRFWTLGEAFIKATGEGLAQDLKGFAFSSIGRPHLTRVEARWSPASRWRFGIPPADA